MSLMRFLVLFVLGFASVAFAQSNGSVSGQVMDPTGAVIPNASVVLSSSSGRATATSDGVGRFHFGSIQPGSYSLSVAAKNFSNFSGRVTVVAGKPVTVNPTLKVQIQEEKVEV